MCSKAEGKETASRELIEETGERFVKSVTEEAAEKTKVIWCNKPHKNGTQGHWEAIVDEVGKMEKSGKYETIL
ncbi:MAG: hypothetical protein K6G26_07805 [Lachnospiraceae bacterium]|nr:hypothetical protein [Lachnospiraceae bacterium]